MISPPAFHPLARQLWSTEANNPGPYVGWSGRNPTITFFFSASVVISQVSIWADYPGTALPAPVEYSCADHRRRPRRVRRRDVARVGLHSEQRRQSLGDIQHAARTEPLPI
jgi:hypothetical protein